MNKRLNERLSKLRAEAQRLAGEKHYTGRSLDLGDIEKTPDFQIFMDRVHASYEFLTELVVKECRAMAIQKLAIGSDKYTESHNGALWSVINEIDEHFGVEE